MSMAGICECKNLQFTTLMTTFAVKQSLCCSLFCSRSVHIVFGACLVMPRPKIPPRLRVIRVVRARQQTFVGRGAYRTLSPVVGISAR